PLVVKVWPDTVKLPLLVARFVRFVKLPPPDRATLAALPIVVREVPPLMVRVELAAALQVPPVSELPEIWETLVGLNVPELTWTAPVLLRGIVICEVPVPAVLLTVPVLTKTGALLPRTTLLSAAN